MYLPVLVVPLLQLLLIFGLGQYLNLMTHAAALPVTTDSVCQSQGQIQPKVFIIDMACASGVYISDLYSPAFISVSYSLGLRVMFGTTYQSSTSWPVTLLFQDFRRSITGEAEINAATTVTALVFSNLFNLATTYFLIAGIAGINPKVASIGDVTFAKYAVQVALQYKFDSREKPENSPTGYVPLGATAPGQFPGSIYGTEVFQLNSQLRDIAVGLAKNATLLDSPAAQELRSIFCCGLLKY
ncbi:hypothetical protein D9757_007826 [Collybiopsis confluens]|uniref:Uncharacterized protein n=1 Tax=Collybiopsis confluens TaxID=2823264 RepID=A0A8H5HQQ1_9AGAR|nr:hypothetical protein D9757_007826 [Collybiopsis confluens]